MTQRLTQSANQSLFVIHDHAPPSCFEYPSYMRFSKSCYKVSHAYAVFSKDGLIDFAFSSRIIIAALSMEKDFNLQLILVRGHAMTKGLCIKCGKEVGASRKSPGWRCPRCNSVYCEACAPDRGTLAKRPTCPECGVAMRE